MNRPIKYIAAIAGALLIIYAIYLSNHTATQLRHDTDQRAVAACASSTELRSLLNDIDGLLKLGDSTDPETLAVHARIHAYTDHNPNCEHLPRRTP